MDGSALKPHDAEMLGKAIKRQLTATKMTPAELARRLGVADSTVSRLLAGQVEDVTIGRIVQIETVLGLPRGHLLRGAAMIDEALTVRQRIEADASLTGEELRIVLRIYDSSVAVSAEERSSSGTKRAPAARSTRRS